MKTLSLAMVAVLAFLCLSQAEHAAGRQLSSLSADEQASGAYEADHAVMGMSSLDREDVIPAPVGSGVALASTRGSSAPSGDRPEVAMAQDGIPAAIQVGHFFVDVTATIDGGTVPLGRAVDMRNVTIQQDALPSSGGLLSGSVGGVPFDAYLTLSVVSFQPLAVSLQKLQVDSLRGKKTFAEFKGIGVVLIPVPGHRDFVRSVTGNVNGIGDVTLTFAGGSEDTMLWHASRACRSQDLSGRAGWQGATGSLAGSVVVTNQSSDACTLQGPPSIQLVDAAGQTLSVKTDAIPPDKPQRTVVLTPGAKAGAFFIWSNWCQPPPHGPITLLVTLPGDEQPIRVRVTDPAGTPLGDAPRCDAPDGYSWLGIDAFKQ